MLDYTAYPSTIADANYTYNKAKDASGATALDGTPLLASFVNDIFGSWQALIKRGGVTPSGSSDNENSSDIADAIMKAISKRFTYSATGTHAADTDAQVDLLICDTSGGDITITIGAPPFTGKRFFVLSTGGNTTFIAGTGLSSNIPVTDDYQLELNSDSSTLYPINHDKRICKAWVNFNGTGVVAIRDSFNVSSITDNGAGDYTVNFTNPMNDVNYISTTTCNAGDGGSNTVMNKLTGGVNTVSSRRFITQNSAGTNVDAEDGYVQIFGS